jgi:2,3-bisphosphoglycerate-dependent phosphoglycerate mutase
VSTRVLLLRHAETTDPSVFHGAESDVGLSDRGRRQAERLAPLLAETRPAVVVSSAMRRAVDTAAPIAAACGLTLRVEPDLHERRVGALSGTSTQGEDGIWPDTLRRWVAGETDYAPPGAESFEDIRGRVLPVWRRLTQKYEGQTLVIVAHGIVCRVLLLTELPGLGPADWHRLGPIRNLGVNELLWSGAAWEAVRLNEVPGCLSE